MKTVVSISILNYERRETLRRCLGKVLAQSWSDLDVIVVDNASTDGSDQMVAEEFPQVHLVRLEKNVGCAARNAGVAAARGEIVITIDNDVLLEDPDSVSRVMQIFERQAAVGCVNFKIADGEGRLSRRDWCHPRDPDRYGDESFLTDYVLEGACAFRRRAFEGVGGYWAPLFLGHEGLDLALRLIDAGHDILYAPEIAITHLVSPEARPSSRIYYTFTRNGIWVSLRNHRAWPATVAIARDLALMAFSSARAGHWGSYIRGVRDALAGRKAAFSSRQSLKRSTYEKLSTIHRLEPSLLAKARRHWVEKPI
jgi:GT2 family glycosyltransferase